MTARAGFDVVVVGGGAAGCVVAARLAESAARSVLLVEAGPDRRADLPEPLRNGWDIAPALFDWGYRSEPDADGVVRDVRRTRLLGGTSWLTRFALRGSAADFAAWAGRGNAGWEFEHVLPYFVRLETDEDFGDRPWHGDRGPMPCTRYPRLDLTEPLAAGLAALEAAGFPAVEDHNRPGAVGAGRMPMSSRNGARVTTADAYLPLGRTPPNLSIRVGAQVAAVLFDGVRARGVRLVDGTVLEAGWVVLCAGTYGSPVLLMRSGIGPAQPLRDLGLPVVGDLPGVGAELADHPAVTIECGSSAAGRTAPVLHAIATAHSEDLSGDEAPDLLLWLSDPTAPPGEPAPFEIDVVLLRPRSRGRVRLRSADPSAPPVVGLPGLGESSDLTRLAEGYRRALEVAHRPEIRRVCTGAARAEPDDEELTRLLRTEVYSLPHVVGTCAMGPRPEDGAVVDGSGRVHQAEALSVVDASILPEPPSGFPHFQVIMVAERLSEFLTSVL